MLGVCSETGKGGSSINNEYWNNEVWCSSSGYETLGKCLFLKENTVGIKYSNPTTQKSPVYVMVFLVFVPQ